MANEIKIVVTGENKASPAIKAATTDLDGLTTSAQKSIPVVAGVGKASETAGQQTTTFSEGIDKASTSQDKFRKQTKDSGDEQEKFRDKTKKSHEEVATFTEKTDQLDTVGANATASLGALGSGFELIGKTGAQDALNKVALATDFLSGVGQGATTVFEHFGTLMKGIPSSIKTFTTNIKDSDTATGKWARTLGVGALAVGALIGVTQALGAAFGQDLSVQTDKLADSLDTWAQTGNKGGEAARVLGSNFKDLSYDLGTIKGGFWTDLGNGISGFVENVTGLGDSMDQSLKHSNEFFSGLDTSLANLVNSGQGDQAKAIFDKIAAEAAKQGVTTADLTKKLPGYTSAVEDNTMKQESWNSQIEDANQALSAQDDAIHQVADSLKKSTDPLFAFEDAQDDLTAKTKAYNKAVKEHGKNSSDAATAQRDLQKSMITYITAAANATNGTGHLTGEQKNLLKSAGASKKEINNLDAALNASWKKANQLDGFDIDITYNQHFKTFGKPYSQAGIDSGDVGGLAHGGVVGGAASGRALSGLTWVGEHGPELISVPAGSVVHSNPDSMRMAAAAASRGAASIVIGFDKSGLSGLGRALLETLRAEIRTQGGNVQQVLGS